MNILNRLVGVLFILAAAFLLMNLPEAQLPRDRQIVLSVLPASIGFAMLAGMVRIQDLGNWFGR